MIEVNEAKWLLTHNKVVEYIKGKCKVEYWVDLDGEKDGEYKKWYKNGQPIVHYFYKKGEIDGECKQWHKNGQFLMHYFYRDGKLDGEYKTWYDGKLESYKFFKDGNEVADFIANPELKEAYDNNA